MKSGPEAYQRAVEILSQGGLVALPTETVYGLAGHAINDDAVTRVYQAKGRPSRNPLIVHVLESEQAYSFADPHTHDWLDALVKGFWPGPLTLVVPQAENIPVSGKALAGLDTLALRCPKAGWTSAFIGLGFEGPLVMPSANRSGHVSPTTAQHVFDDLGDVIDLIIDDGPCPGGIESTVLGMEDDHTVLLRPGSTSVDDLVPFISDLRLPNSSAKPTAPGMLKSHYAPKAKVRLDAHDKRPGEAYLGFGPTELECDLNLSESGNLEEAARNLYAFLRKLDTVQTIAIAPIPSHGLGEALNDRLRRAAADR